MGRAILLTVFLLLLGTTLEGQMTIGHYSLTSASAPHLRNSIGSEGFAGGFLASVGEVAFDHVAASAAGFAPGDFILKYVNDNPDGRRAMASLEGRQVRIALYDCNWCRLFDSLNRPIRPYSRYLAILTIDFKKQRF